VIAGVVLGRKEGTLGGKSKYTLEKVKPINESPLQACASELHSVKDSLLQNELVLQDHVI
jgi:hypothetical protein